MKQGTEDTDTTEYLTDTTEYPADTNTDDEPEVGDIENYTEAERQRKVALFILKAREERMLTQNTLDGLLQDITCKYLHWGITNT